MNSEAVFRGLFWGLIVLLLLVRVIFGARVRQAGERNLPDQAAIRREGVGMFLTRVVMFLALIFMLVVYALNPRWVQSLLIPMPDWIRWAGLVLGILSLGLLTWSQVELGRHWSAQLQLREGHRLVTTGPYSRVRHPLYTGLFGIGIGFALVTAHWIFVFLALVVILGMGLRVPKEEGMMIDQFGDEYRQYMAKTGRYLPRM